MAIDTIRVRTESPGRDTVAGAVDVSNVPADRMEALVREAGARNVYLERRAGRTYLVPAD